MDTLALLHADCFMTLASSFYRFLLYLFPPNTSADVRCQQEGVSIKDGCPKGAGRRIHP
jgi:hypothetical protein